MRRPNRSAIRSEERRYRLDERRTLVPHRVGDGGAFHRWATACANCGGGRRAMRRANANTRLGVVARGHGKVERKSWHPDERPWRMGAR